MSAPYGNDAHPFGSAGFAGPEAVARAGMFRQGPDSLFLGFMDSKPVWYAGQGGVLLVAGARGGKLRDILAYNVCSGICTHSMIVLDVKGELAAISRDQTPDRKHCLYWNPARLHDLPYHRINPVDYLCAGSPSLVSDIKVFAQNMIPDSRDTKARYFEGRAREFLEGVVLTLVKLHGVLTLPDLYHVLNLIPDNGEDWLDFAFEMSVSGLSVVKRVEAEIAGSRKNEGGSFKDIMGELLQAFACLSDSTLLESVSPPFDVSLKDLCAKDRAYQVYFMPPAEFVQAWAPVLKSLFVAGKVYKSRAPSAPPQTWVLDECAQLGGFPIVPQLFSIGAGQGIRPVAVFQNTRQMNALGPDAEAIITASAQARIYFAVRDLETASALSRMLGEEILEYRDEQRAVQLRHARMQAAQTLMSGGDPIRAGLDMAHLVRMERTPSVKARLLRAPDEVLSEPSDKMFLFVDGVAKCIHAERKPYYEQGFMAGRYHPNPYHPPADRVRVKTGWGMRWRKVVHEPVPARFKAYPQYRGGTWSRVQ